MKRALRLLQSSKADIVFLVAPAGYGKSTLAAALQQDYTKFATCDCAQLTTPQSLAAEVLSALGEFHPEHSGRYADLQIRVKNALDQRECANIIDSVWQTPSGHSLFILENAEVIADNGPVAALVTNLLRTSPAERRILICSRTLLPTRAGRYLQPHRLLTVTTEQLALTDDEAEELLRDHGVPQAYWPQIVQAAQGWPILLLLFARFATEGRLETIINRSDAALEDLFCYMLQEVVEPLDDATVMALVLGGTIPRLTIAEAAHALKMPVLALQTRLRAAPLVHRDGDVFSVHNLMKEALLERGPDWMNHARSVAEYAHECGNIRRAAQIYRSIGDPDAFAQELSFLTVDQLMSADYAGELAHVPTAAMRSHPKLALATFNRLGFTPELRVQLIEVFETLSPDEDPALVANIARAIVSANWWFGDVEGNEKLLSSPRLRAALSSGSKIARDAFLGVQECYYASLGQIESNIGLMRKAYEEALAARLPHPRTLLARKIASSERWRGQRQASIEWSESAIRHARESGSALLYSSLLIDALTNAWFWGDEHRVSAYESELESWSARNGYSEQFSSLHAALRASASIEALPLPRPNRVFVCLMAASACSEVNRRNALISQAQAESRTTGEEPLMVLCAVAHAALEPPQRVPILNDAIAGIDRTELPHLHAALTALCDGAPSFLDRFVARFSQTHTDAEPAPGVRIELLHERVRIRDSVTKLSAREAALAAYISRQRSPVPREEIQDALWPELDETSARDSLYSLLYRLRKRAGNQVLFENCGNAYRLAAGVDVDLWTLWQLARQIERGEPVLLDDLERTHCALVQRSYPHLLLLEWFGAIDYKIREAGRIIGRRLIDESFSRRDYDAVIRYANDLIEDDEADDLGHGALIRVHIERGDIAEAQRLYRRYCSTLKRTIEAAPDPEIQELMGRYNTSLVAAS